MSHSVAASAGIEMSPLLAGVVFGGSAMAAEATNSAAIAFQDSFIVFVRRPAHLTAKKSSVPSHFYDRVAEGMRRVIVGTPMSGPVASCFSNSSYFDAPAAS